MSIRFYAVQTTALLMVCGLAACSTTTTPIGSSEVPSISRPGTTYNIKDNRPSGGNVNKLCFASARKIVTLAGDNVSRQVVIGLVPPGDEKVYTGTGFSFSTEMIGSDTWDYRLRDDRIRNNPDIVAPPGSTIGVNVYENGRLMILNDRGQVAPVGVMPSCNGKEIKFGIRTFITILPNGRVRVTPKTDWPR